MFIEPVKRYLFIKYPATIPAVFSEVMTSKTVLAVEGLATDCATIHKCSSKVDSLNVTPDIPFLRTYFATFLAHPLSSLSHLHHVFF